jgi:hypothetical protein
MAHTTVANVETHTNEVYSEAQRERVGYWIEIAERELRASAAGDWYDTSNPESAASQDWVLAVCYLVDAAMASDDPEVRQALHSPYRKETIGDWSYELKDAAAQTVGVNIDAPRIQRIISRYVAPPVPDEHSSAMGMLLAGPRRSAQRQLWPPEGADMTRGGW